MKTINLIQTKAPVSAETEVMTLLLRRISLWALAILITSGLIVSGIFYYIRARATELTRTKLQLSQIVTENATKEGLLTSIKQRTAQITKILGVQKPVKNVFDILVLLAPPDQISSVSLDEANKVSLMISAKSITEAVLITDALIREAALHNVRSPELISLVLGKDGGVDIGLSFIAVFN